MAAFPRIFYDNRLADGTLVPSSTASGNFAAANLADWRRYTYWKPATMPASITVDSGAPKAADYSLHLGADLFTQGVSVEVHGSTDNFASSDVLVASGAPTSDDPFLLSFNSASFRYWRHVYTGFNAPTIPVAAIGAAFQFPVGLSQGFDPLGRTVNGDDAQNVNENGHPIGRVIYFEEWEQQCTFENVAWSWIRATFLPAWRAQFRSTPFAFGWDVVSFPTEIVLVNAGMDFATPHRSGSVADLVLTMRGVIT